MHMKNNTQYVCYDSKTQMALLDKKNVSISWNESNNFDV